MKKIIQFVNNMKSATAARERIKLTGDWTIQIISIL